MLRRDGDRTVTLNIEPWADRGRRSNLAGGWPALFACAGLIASYLYLVPATTARAQSAVRAEGGAEAESLSRIDADYQQQRARIDRERIERLTRLAAGQKGGEAELTYLEVFRFAIASDRYVEAEPAAERVIGSGAAGQEAGFLAQLVNIIAEAERGDYEGS